MSADRGVDCDDCFTDRATAQRSILDVTFVLLLTAGSAAVEPPGGTLTSLRAVLM